MPVKISAKVLKNSIRILCFYWYSKRYLPKQLCFWVSNFLYWWTAKYDITVGVCLKATCTCSNNKTNTIRLSPTSYLWNHWTWWQSEETSGKGFNFNTQYVLIYHSLNSMCRTLINRSFYIFMEVFSLVLVSVDFYNNTGWKGPSLSLSGYLFNKYCITCICMHINDS